MFEQECLNIVIKTRDGLKKIETALKARIKNRQKENKKRDNAEIKNKIKTNIIRLVEKLEL